MFLTLSHPVVVVLLIILLLVAAFLLLCVLVPPILMTLIAKDKMAAGISNMNGLTEADMQTWIDRAQDYANRHPDTMVMLSGNDVPSELKELGIIQIDVFTALARSPREVGFV